VLAVNWNKLDDVYSLTFWRQNVSQFWLDDEIATSADKNTWNTLSTAEKEAYKKVLGGLTLLDTKQGGVGMHLIPLHIESLQAQAIFTFMGAMEQIHAKSYSTIFTTLATEEEIEDIFEWVDKNPLLERKLTLIMERYNKLFTPFPAKTDIYMALVASVYLESFLFYSGFFYPLYFAGQGKLTASGEIINLIIRDESIHGVFTGLIAQEIFKTLTPTEQVQVQQDQRSLLMELYDNEVEYTLEIYQSVGLVDEVNKFLRYNANKALMNLGLDIFFADEPINPIIENGLKTDTKNHDFFSVKGNGYVKATNVEKLKDEDFIF